MKREDQRTGHGPRQIVGKPVGFEEFYRREVRSVLAVTIALTRSRWEAEEATQEAFLKAFRDWERVGQMPAPVAWVRRTAVNLAIGRWRRTKAEARALLRLDRPLPTDVPADPDADRFWEAVRSLPKRQAQVVALTYVEDLDSEGVAGVLGISASTVRVHLARAREELARVLEVEQ